MPETRVSPERRHIFSVSLRCQNARQHFTRAAFVREFTGTMPGPRVSPECRHTLCASLRSRNALGDFSCTSLRSGNALGDFTRATLYGTLQVKGHGPAGAP